MSDGLPSVDQRKAGGAVAPPNTPSALPNASIESPVGREADPMPNEAGYTNAPNISARHLYLILLLRVRLLNHLLHHFLPLLRHLPVRRPT